jgi:hypothetical protein
MKYKLISKAAELKPGESHFTIRYSYNGVGFRTIIPAKDSEAAKRYFNTYYGEMNFVSIRKGIY